VNRTRRPEAEVEGQAPRLVVEDAEREGIAEILAELLLEALERDSVATRVPRQ